MNVENTGQIQVNSRFGRCIINYASDPRFTRFLEIGTWNGQGSTCCFYEGFKHRTDIFTLQSYEIAKNRVDEARNVWSGYSPIQIIHGRILKDSQCPTWDQVKSVHSSINPEWHTEDIKNFWNCNYIPMNDPQVILLDGSEYLTWFEFEKMINTTNASVYLLDDTNTSKCPKIVEWFKDHPEWKRIAGSDKERNGWVVYEKNPKKRMIAAKLNGGLGNQLFQLAAAETIASETNRIFCIVDTESPTTVHSSANYFDSILSQWKSLPNLPIPYSTLAELVLQKEEWNQIVPFNESLCIEGYFQNWRYIPEDFISRLTLPSVEKREGAFLHIRGGDFVNHWLHDVGLQNSYYQDAIQYFPKDTHFFIFTNDVDYAKKSSFLSTIQHTFVEEDEATSLAGMANCTKGGICSNSTFSWWGAYLNRNRTIVMPTKFFNDSGIPIEGYYFPGTIVCQV